MSGRPYPTRGAPLDLPKDGTFNTTERRYLIIDPETGSVLAEETVLTRRVAWIDGEPGDVVGSITILRQGWVDSVGDRPAERR